MAKVAVLVAPQVGLVIAPAFSFSVAAVVLADRIANGEAFHGEHVVRLPRRISRSICVAGRYSHGFIKMAMRRGRLLPSSSDGY